MENGRPIGIKVVSAILFFESMVLIVSASVSYLSPSLAAEAVGPFLRTIPYFRNLPLADAGPMISIAFAFAAFALLKGFGVWFKQQWARYLILLDLAMRFGGSIWAVALLDGQQVHALISDHDFVISVLINLVVLGLLLDPSTAAAFEKHQS